MADYAQAGNYSGAQAGNSVSAKPIEAPRTITSAISKVDGLNDRLAKVREHLTGIADQIGGPRLTGDSSKNAERVPSVGVVGKLNDSTEYAHNYVSDIENLLGSIGRALG